MAGRLAAACLRLALALAVAKPGSRALTIDRENRAGEWRSIQSAVDRGVPFAVEVRPDILAIDADSPDAPLRLGSLAGRMRALGLEPVTVWSGRQGHQHVFASVIDDPIRDEIKAWANAQGLDVRKTIRPPLTPHREGLEVRLEDPACPGAALAALMPLHLPGLCRDQRILSLIRYGDRDGRYRTRSELVQAIAVMAVNARWGFPRLRAALLAPSAKAGEKIREIAAEKGDLAAERYLQRTYSRAEGFVQANPPIQCKEEALALLWAVRASADSATDLSPSDHAVLRAHLEIAGRCGGLEYNASERELAEIAGVSRPTVRLANGRLASNGWIRLVKGGSGLHASLWLVTRRSLSISISHPPLDRYGERMEGPDRHGKGMEVAADVWRAGKGGPGQSGRRVHEVLRREGSICALDVVRFTGLSESTVRRALSRLEKGGLVEREGGSWRATDRDLTEVAAELGLAGVGARQKQFHDLEREAQRLRVRRWVASAPPRAARRNSETEEIAYGC